MPQFYAYLWLRLDGTPYYAGKGCGRRAYQKDGHRVNPPSRDRIIVIPRKTEAAAFALEMAWIRFLGRKDIGTGCLRNLTDGGDQPPSNKGKPKSENFRRLLSERNRGNTWALGTKNRLGIPHSAEAKAKLSAAGLGRKQTAQAIAKTRAAVVGVPKSPEHREKLRIAQTGKKASLAARAKMRASHLARQESEFLKMVAWG
jgi:hypothetical protein